MSVAATLERPATDTGGYPMRTQSTCSIPDCEKRYFARGWCSMHFTRAARHGSPEWHQPTFQERFWAKVPKGKPGDCWEWAGARDSDGYGVFAVSHRIQRKAHRLAYEFGHGEITADMMVCHACDNPPCCNSGHLFLGSAKDNSQDRDAKGRGTQLAGELCSWRKLTAEDVEEIRAKYATGRWLQRELAEQYGVSQTGIGKVVRRVIWKVPIPVLRGKGPGPE